MSSHGVKPSMSFAICYHLAEPILLLTNKIGWRAKRPKEWQQGHELCPTSGIFSASKLQS